MRYFYYYYVFFYLLRVSVKGENSPWLTKDLSCLIIRKINIV